MQQITQVSCGDTYTDAATLSEVFNSSGGYFSIAGNDAYVELQYGGLGQFFNTNEAPVPVGNGILQAGTTGVRFRNLTPGAVAIVTAALYAEAEPALIITSPGTVSVAGSLSGITGSVTAAGGITSGSGFTPAHGGTGQYSLTFTTPFPTPPIVLVTPGPLANEVIAWVTGVSAGTCAISINDSTGSAADAPFFFVAFTTV